MSHQYTATLENTKECISVLEDSKSSLQETLNHCRVIAKSSSRSMDEALRKLFSEIEGECEARLRETDSQINCLNVAVDEGVVNSTKGFVSETNILKFKIYSFDKALNDSIMTGTGRNRRQEALQERLSGIRDTKLRSMIALLSKNEKRSSMSFDELRELAECQINPSKKVSRKVSEIISAEIEQNLNQDTSADAPTVLRSNDTLNSPTEMIAAATSEIIDERLRKSAIQAIVKSISEKGFIVEKKNIRLIRETNTVKITAMKPGNQKAEFFVDLDGRFNYRFDGYEGRACEKDIEPFEEDLERIYGINIRERKTIWDNPDKITKSHYAEMKSRRDS